MALVRKILETTLAAESTSVVFTDSDIPNSLLRVYTTKSDLFPLSQTISGNNLTVNYEAQTSNVGVALEIVKQGLTINDTLTSDATDQALSAKQGKTLKTLIDGITVPGELTDLSDVDVTNIQDGQVLAWSDNDQKFINVNQSGGTSSLDDLSDVTITSVQNGQILKYNSTSQKWENSTESAGGGSTITITTSDSTLYGETITLSDGTVTLSTTFSNSGEATFSGVTMTGDLTATCGVEVRTVSIPYFGNYDIDFDQSTTEVTLTIYSAKEDTISYTDIDGITQTITFASGATSKQVQITINPNGSSITFTSSVAKNPNNLSQYYSKTFTITTSTTEIYLMPDAVNTLYWWGYESGNFEDCTSANGWSLSGYILDTPTFNTFDITLSARSWDTAGHRSAVASKTQVSASKLLSVAQGIIELSGYGYGSIRTATSKSFDNQNDNSQLISSTNMIKVENSFTQGNYYLFAACDGGGSGQSSKIYALWYE